MERTRGGTEADRRQTDYQVCRRVDRRKSIVDSHISGPTVRGAWSSSSRETNPNSWNNVMTLSPSGNVGIGTTNPGDHLTVGGASLADTKIEVNAGGDQYAGLRIKNSQGSWVWQVVPSADSPGGKMRTRGRDHGQRVACYHAHPAMSASARRILAANWRSPPSQLLVAAALWETAPAVSAYWASQLAEMPYLAIRQAVEA